MTLAGTVSGLDGDPRADVPLAVRSDGRVSATVRSDTAGHFAVELLPGDYAVEVVPGLGFEVGEAMQENVAGDTGIELRAEPLSIPAELRRTALLYGRLRSYSDTTQLQDQTDRGLVQSRGTRERVLAFERPRRIRLSAPGLRHSETVVVCDGESFTALYDDAGETEYLSREVPDDLRSALIATTMWMGTMVDGLVLRLLLAEDPVSILARGTTEIRKAGEERLDGTATWIFELQRSRWAGPGPRDARAMGETMVVQVWVGQEDHLIRQVVIEELAPRDTMARLEAGTRRRAWVHRSIGVNSRLPDGTFVLDVPADARMARWGAGWVRPVAP